jgi:hypothetical protein
VGSLLLEPPIRRILIGGEKAAVLNILNEKAGVDIHSFF